MIYRCRQRLMVTTALMMAMLCAPVAAVARQTAQLVGSVVDQTGAPLPGVRVSLRGAAARDAHTDSNGVFLLTGLPQGDYEITAELSGFQRVQRTVRVAATERTTVSLTLHVAIVEETIVTAAKSGERDVQSMPMAISAISTADLGRLGAQMLPDVTALAPSVTLSQNTGFGQLTIRGIGTNAVNAGSDPSSAMYLDGVYLGRPAMSFTQFLDLDRVEVLRGPQGTLYGRNAVGGAINLVSRVPTNDVDASASVTAGNFDAWRANARISGPLKRDRLMASAAFVRHVRDGYVRDLDHPDHPLGGEDVFAARGQLRVVFGRRTDLLVSTDVDVQDGTPLTFSKVIAAKPGFQFDNPPDLHDVRTSTLASNHTLQSGTSARLTFALTPSTSLVSLTAFRRLHYEFVVDADITEINLLATNHLERQHQWSQEITLSHRRPRLSWVGGVFVFDEFDHQSYWVDQFAARTQIRLDPRVDALSRAVYGEATFGVTSRLSATAGLRYTHEGKDIENAGGRFSLDDPALAVPGTPYQYVDSITHSAWTPKIGLEVTLPNDALAYVSATRGFKSGGFNPSSTGPGRGYAPEWAWSYEGGWKSSFRGGRSRFAVSAFVMDYTNLQVQTPLAIGIFDIRNAAAATIRGVEAETTFLIGRGLQAGGHVTWLDATYDQYVAVATDGTTGDVAGNRLNNAPEWAGRFWVEWRRDFSGSRRVTVAADTSAQSTVFYTPFNDGIQFQPAYGLLGARVEYGPSQRRWSVAVYGRNLTNTDYVTATFGTVPTAFGGRPGPSRQVAVELAIRR